MKKLFLSIVLIMFSFISFGQWNQQFGWPNQFNAIKTNGTVNSVGVGDFNSPINIRARLHVNSNLMPAEWDGGFWWWHIYLNLHYSKGNLFRTDGSDAVENNWTMWTGPTGSTTEKAKLFVDTDEGADDFSIQATIDDMIFNTGGPNERARILGSNGFVGINTPTPTDRVEINSAIADISGLTFTQLDNSVTPLANPSSGVLSLDENGRVIWVEGGGGGGADLDWDYISSNPDMFSIPAGNVGIGLTTPNFLLDVNGDIDILPATSAYFIDGNAVLKYHGDPFAIPSTTNIFVGVGAGNNNTLGANNAFVGHNAGHNNTIGLRNTCLGDSAGFSNKIESDNTFIGFNSGYNTISGPGNTFVGVNTGFHNTTGEGNIFMGVETGYNNTTGDYNTFVGNLTGRQNTTGRGNCFYGKHAGYSNTTGIGNVFVGSHSGVQNTTTNVNIFLGNYTGVDNTGDTNIFIGSEAGLINEGTGNIFLGNFVGMEHTNGDNNTYIGHRAQNLASDFTNTTAIGANTIVTADNTMILGDINVNVGIGLSGVTPAPQNTLEINARDINGNVVSDASGLRFRQLTSSSPFTIPAPPGVLSVNADGDVIYVDAADGGAGDDDWDRVGEDIFTGTTGLNIPTLATGNVVIGAQTPFTINDPYPLVSPKLSILQTLQDINEHTVAVSIENQDTGCIGLVCRVTNPMGSINTAAYFEAIEGTDEYYAIIVPPNGGYTGLGTVAPEYLLDVSGPIRVEAMVYYSDSIYKINTDSIENPVDKINQLNGIYFEWDTLNNPEMNFETDRQIGFIGQDVYPVIPEAVEIDDLGLYNIKYSSIIPVLVEAFKKQQSIIESYEAKFNYYDSLLSLFNYYDSLLSQFNYHNSLLSQCCNQCCNINNDSNNSIQIEDGENFDNNILYQNRPNPFSKKTEINYYLTENVFNASILIFDMQGTLVKNYNLSTFKGKDKLTING